MQKITFYSIAFLLTGFISYGQLNVTVRNLDGTGWGTFVNALNRADNSFAFGFSYNLPKQTARFDGSSISLRPNFGIWVDENTNSAWFTNPGTPPSNPNKIIAASTFLSVTRTSNPEYFTQDVIFSGNVSTFSLASGYTAKAFIRVFNSDFSASTGYEANITASGNFSVTRPAADANAGDQNFQYGFIVTGLPADPALESSLGVMTVQPSTPASTESEVFNSFKVFPNPAADSWVISNDQQSIESITIFDVSGKSIITQSVQGQSVKVDGSQFSTGIYFAQVQTALGTSTLKLIKK